MTRRPRNAHRDKTSHAAVRDWLKARGCYPAVTMRNPQGAIWYHGGHYCGLPLQAMDVSSIPGWIDWLVWIGVPGNGVCCSWECKEPGNENRLTDGESEWINQSLTLCAIIVDADDCEGAAARAIGLLA